MPPSPAPECPHDRGHATTICLHCRRDARRAARQRRRRTAGRITVAVLALGVVTTVGIGGAAAFQGRPVIPLLLHSGHARRTPRPPAARAAAPFAGPVVTTSPPPLAPVLAEGTTPLPDSFAAVRTGDTVTVHFDTRLARTRRPHKFERIVRATLAAVFGSRADSALARVPDGGLVAPGTLLTTLPRRGIHLPLAGGWSLGIWPETRPSLGGPLVVSYRALVAR